MGRNFTEALGRPCARSTRRARPAGLGDAPEWEALGALEPRRSPGRPSTASSTCSRCCAPAAPAWRQLFEATKIDPWFLDQLQLLNEVAERDPARPAP